MTRQQATAGGGILKRTLRSVWRFFAWWGTLFAFFASVGTTCPFCGQQGCPGGPASAGFLGGVVAAAMFLPRRLGGRFERGAAHRSDSRRPGQ